MARDDEFDDVDIDTADDDLEVMDADGEGFGAVAGFVSGLIVGAIAGAGLALLLAPERGEVVRRRLGARFQDMREDARDRFETIKDDTGRRVAKERRRLRRKLRRKS